MSPDLDEGVGQILAALAGRFPRGPQTIGENEPAKSAMSVDRVDVPMTELQFMDLDIAAEDRVDDDWEVPSVEPAVWLPARQCLPLGLPGRAGTTTLARNEDIEMVTPQWLMRGKSESISSEPTATAA